MSTHWNSSYTNNQNGPEHSRPSISSPTMLACRACDQIFLNAQSLLQHYETHVYENAQRNQNHQINPYISSMRVSRERNLTNSPFQSRLTNPSTLLQRHHPYLPNGYRTLQHERASIPQTRPTLASTQTPNIMQQRRPVANNNAVGASFQVSNCIPGRNVARGSPFIIHHQLSPAQRALFPKVRGQNESAEMKTVWYLSQLEKPIPKIINLERDNELRESLELDLTLKL